MALRAVISADAPSICLDIFLAFSADRFELLLGRSLPLFFPQTCANIHTEPIPPPTSLSLAMPQQLSPTLSAMSPASLSLHPLVPLAAAQAALLLRHLKSVLVSEQSFQMSCLVSWLLVLPSSPRSTSYPQSPRHPNPSSIRSYG